MKPDKLSLLSDAELQLIAEHMGIYIPDGLDRQFIIEEIIMAIEDDKRERVFSHDGTGHVEEKKLSGGNSLPSLGREPSSLPDRYNETMICALPRDPAWIYAYWDISESARSRMGESFFDIHLFLRVLELGAEMEHKRDFFDIGVTFDDWKWYINVPTPGARYRVDLCMKTTDRIKVLARSNEIFLPVYYMRQNAALPQITRSLLILSGCEGLHLTEPKGDNPSRILDAAGEQDGE